MCACLLTALNSAADVEALRLRVRPMVAFEPTNVRVEVYIQRDADNRALRVSGDGDLFFWNSERQLEGDRSPVISTFSYYEIPAGEYQVRAELFDSLGRVRATATEYLKVLPRFASDAISPRLPLTGGSHGLTTRCWFGGSGDLADRPWQQAARVAAAPMHQG
jgi:hypothetical protein